jgi:hypothetical protein
MIHRFTREDVGTVAWTDTYVEFQSRRWCRSSGETVENIEDIVRLGKPTEDERRHAADVMRDYRVLMEQWPGRRKTICEVLAQVEDEDLKMRGMFTAEEVKK